MTGSATTVLVTGGTGGLGVAVVQRLLDDGRRVVVPYRSPEGVRRLPAHPRLETVQADLTVPTDVDAAVAAAAADPSAPLRGLANLAGGFAMGPRLHETPIDDFDAMLRMNLRPTYLVSQAVLPHLLESGGSVVCVSARAALAPFTGGSGYVTAKAAVLSLVAAMAVEYRREGVRVNAVLPSVIDTPGNRASQPDADRRNWVSPEAIAKVIAYLLADDSAPITGAQVPVPGVG